jgi:hypothetical protein
MKQLWLGLLATLITLPIPCQARPNQEGAYEVLGVDSLTVAAKALVKELTEKATP